MPRAALVVEDEQDTGMLLAEHLRRWGYEPTVMNRGKSAISWVRDNQPDLILLDLLLPDIDGFEICEVLKLERDTNLIPIIMISALTAKEDKLKGLKVGANQYLPKPFDSEELHGAIEQAFSWKKEMENKGSQGEIQFQLQSDTKYLEELNGLLSALLLYSGLDEDHVRQLTTAVREMGTNAIEWGHQKQVDMILNVTYHIDSEKVTIVIEDRGPGFNPKNVPHAADPEDPVSHMMVREALGLREGGFGILMSRGLVDDLQYNETGNEVRLVKYFSPQKSSQRNQNN